MPTASKRFLSLTVLALASVAAIATSVLGCSGGDEGDTSCYDYAAFDGTAPAVAFTADVLPILRTSCGLSNSCHGSEAAPMGQPYLGPPNGPAATQAQIDAIFAQNVSVKASKASEMNLIEPGKPDLSFMMHKIDGTFSCATVACDSACGGQMPVGAPLDAPKADTIRRWIAQGAKKD